MRVQVIQCLNIFLSLLFGCSETIIKNLDVPKPGLPWTALSVKANSTEYLLYEATDSLIIKQTSFNKKDTVFIFTVSKQQKDSLFAWTQALLENKIQPTKFCTDYFGKLRLQVVYSEKMSKQVTYSSICEWETLDSNTNKIYQLLSKIKTVN